MPTLNAARYLKGTIATIQAQEYGGWEVLVLDAGSSDGTLDIAHAIGDADPRIRTFVDQGAGYWEALYLGTGRASGEFIAIVCASDGYVNPEWLRWVIRAVDENSDVSLIWGIPFVMSEDGVLEGPHQNYAIFLRGSSFLERFSGMWHHIRSRARYLNLLRWPEFVRKISGTKVCSLYTQATVASVPQKADWFPYWLKTGLIFPDGNMCVRKSVWYACSFEGRLNNKLAGVLSDQAHYDFYYNFNSRGYLPICLPIPANFGRVHAGQATQVVQNRAGEAKRRIDREYFERIARLARRGRCEVYKYHKTMEISEEKKVRLHLGCGENYLEGNMNVDLPPSEHTMMRPKAEREFGFKVETDFEEGSKKTVVWSSSEKKHL